MTRRVLFVFLLLVSISFIRAEAYTVVLKNGKVMTGTLVSETEDTIIFKDDKGFQFSLKKASLDLEKMKEANEQKSMEPAPETPPPTTKPATPPTKKKGRIYTREDTDRLKEKYGELDTGEPIENVEDYEGGVLKPEAYNRYMKNAGSKLADAMDDFSNLGNGVATAWEVADSTGKDANEAVQAYLSAESTMELSKSADAAVAGLEDLREKLAQVPKGYSDAYKLFTAGIEAIKSYQNLVKNRGEIENASLYRSRIQDLSTQVSTIATQLENLSMPQPEKPAKKTTPPAEQPPAPEEGVPPSTTEEQPPPPQ